LGAKHLATLHQNISRRVENISARCRERSAIELLALRFRRPLFSLHELHARCLSDQQYSEHAENCVNYADATKAYHLERL
jgi:hypothetical protein